MDISLKGTKRGSLQIGKSPIRSKKSGILPTFNTVRIVAFSISQPFLFRKTARGIIYLRWRHLFLWDCSHFNRLSWISQEDSDRFRMILRLYLETANPSLLFVLSTFFFQRLSFTSASASVKNGQVRGTCFRLWALPEKLCSGNVLHYDTENMEATRYVAANTKVKVKSRLYEENGKSFGQLLFPTPLVRVDIVN